MCQLRHALILQCGQYLFWQLLSTRQIHDLDLTAVTGIAKQQDLKIRGFRVFIDAALGKVSRGIRFYINV